LTAIKEGENIGGGKDGTRELGALMTTPKANYTLNHLISSFSKRENQSKRK
jgi:hypothetical protein